MESKKQSKICNSQIQRTDWWMPERVVKGGKMGEGDQGIQFNYKISHRDVMYSMVTVVNDTMLQIQLVCGYILEVFITRKKLVTVYIDRC